MHLTASATDSVAHCLCLIGSLLRTSKVPDRDSHEYSILPYGAAGFSQAWQPQTASDLPELRLVGVSLTARGLRGCALDFSRRKDVLKSGVVEPSAPVYLLCTEHAARMLSPDRQSLTYSKSLSTNVLYDLS